MGLADFILANVEPILAEWEAIARTIWPGPADTGPAELRDHAAEILRATAADMRSPQTAAEQADKSKGEGGGGAAGAGVAAASDLHAAARVRSGFDLMTVVAEYRALRASVIRLWRDSGPPPDARDVDELTRFHESIDQSVTDAVRSYTERTARARQMFLAILGHDLRNPLSAMKLTGHLIAHSGRLDGALAEMAAQLEVSAAAMTRLVDDLLDYTGSELAGGTLPMAPAPMDLGRLCEQVVNELRAAFPACPVRFDRRGDLRGTWDAGRLRQVVSNLLGNAIQHGGLRGVCQDDGPGHSGGGGPADAPSGGGPVSVDVAGGDGDDGGEGGAGVTLAVHNPGPPIPPDVLPTIFEPMVRGGRAGGRRGSLGLGLYIARAIVTAHGGTIDVASTAEAGMTFTVRLPRRQPRP
ncbi:MAG TPA: HAMP domain-containing sensor histidine kinase [Tepidisphaeraceae bacterium]|nr:HAMP domain-containing sensor histidine kinase [Tepidisphaeraceae bacterium]